MAASYRVQNLPERDGGVEEIHGGEAARHQSSLCSSYALRILGGLQSRAAAQGVSVLPHSLSGRHQHAAQVAAMPGVFDEREQSQAR